MNKKISNLINWLNISMTILIVVLHSTYLPENPSGLIRQLHSLTTTIGDVAVPTFFVVSSYLFFYNLDIENYKTKIQKRIASLVIPYLIWSLMFYMFYLICSLNPQIKSIMNYNRVDFSLWGMVRDILLCKYIPQFWYIRTLFIVAVLSIVFLEIARIFGKRLAIIMVFALYICNILIHPSSTGILYWIPLFWLTGWCALFYKEKICSTLSCRGSNKNIYVLFFFLVAFIVSLFETNWVIYSLWKNVSPILVVLMFKSINLIERECNFSKYSFYIYSMHYCFIAIFRKLFLIIFVQNDVGIILTCLTTVVFSVIISSVVAVIINNVFPTFIVNLLIGNRRRR